MPQYQLPDIFTGDAFSAVTLTASINDVPYTPQLLGSMGLFAVDGVRTTDIAIHSQGGALSIVQTSERGAPPGQIANPKGTMRKESVRRLSLEASVYADEVQSTIGYAQSTGQPVTPTAQDLLTERFSGPFGLRARLELTQEYHRLGAIKGMVLDADGAVLHDWFQFFGIAPLADVEIDFATFTADERKFEVQCTQLVRDMARETEGFPLVGLQPVALCGDQFYDRIYANKEVAAARGNRDTGRDADVFGQSKAFSRFEYGGIVWANYRGTKDGAVGIGANEARLFPAGVPGLFQMLFGPPDIMGLTNMRGLPVYAFMPPERQTSRAAVIEAQSNPLTLCMRPRALRRLILKP
ncbi:major capsid protein [Fodinicurvata sp. EGI_FJ10296]|uniref:major capsid protein n=1 Tax=Fodinicurvata sp. EGI_FJ10296 TaxID=3231908 RepID=UPI003452410D